MHFYTDLHLHISVGRRQSVVVGTPRGTAFPLSLPISSHTLFRIHLKQQYDKKNHKISLNLEMATHGDPMHSSNEVASSPPVVGICQMIITGAGDRGIPVSGP
jgi:hypothetical protein